MNPTGCREAPSLTVEGPGSSLLMGVGPRATDSSGADTRCSYVFKNIQTNEVKIRFPIVEHYIEYQALITYHRDGILQ